MSRIAATFAALGRDRRKALIPYVTAGDPFADATVEIMQAMAKAGADVIELGVPFSDPMADGPVIQKAGERALARGIGLARILAMVAQFRALDVSTPVVLMGYANPIERYGIERFADDAETAGVDGVLVVDYPPEECVDFAKLLTSRGIDPIFLLAPTSTEARIREVGRIATGYVYYVSLKGVTGAGNIDVSGVAAAVRESANTSRCRSASASAYATRLRHARWRRWPMPSSSERPWCNCSKAPRATMLPPRPPPSSPASARRSTPERTLPMSWLEKLLPPKIQQTNPNERRQVPEGLWIKCPSCETVLYKSDLEKNLGVCPKCGQHHRIGARARLDAFLDPEGRYEIGQEVLAVDALKFKDSRKYSERLKDALEQTGETDALVVMGGALHSIPVVAACFEFEFMGGSMGSVVGERFVRGVTTAIEQKTPFISFTATGGARMQEGLLSLMQMAKTNAALTRLAKAKLPYISVLTDPTMGGVSASFAFVGDVVIAEPKALIGFAGPRVIENTVREKLPEGFQRSEFLLQTGAIDMIVDRRELRGAIARQVAMLQRLSSDAVA